MKNTASPRSPWRKIRSFGTVNRGRNSLATRSSSRSFRPTDVEPFDQTMRVQTDLETRPPFGGTAAGDASLQIVVELLRDQSLFEQGLISPHLSPQRRLAKKPVFQCRYVIGILSTQRVEGIAEPRPDAVR